MYLAPFLKTGNFQKLLNINYYVYFSFVEHVHGNSFFADIREEKAGEKMNC